MFDPAAPEKGLKLVGNAMSGGRRGGCIKQSENSKELNSRNEKEEKEYLL